MSDSELLIVLGGAAVLILATFFSTLRRNKGTRTDYWLPDGSRVRRPKGGQALSHRSAAKVHGVIHLQLTAAAVAAFVSC